MQQTTHSSAEPDGAPLSCRAQATRAQRKAETYRRRMAALGQPVFPVDQLTPTYVPSYQQPLQGIYQDPSVAQSYGTGAEYLQVPVYQKPFYQGTSGGMHAGMAPLAGALQWERPQVV